MLNLQFSYSRIFSVSKNKQDLTRHRRNICSRRANIIMRTIGKILCEFSEIEVPIETFRLLSLPSTVKLCSKNRIKSGLWRSTISALRAQCPLLPVILFSIRELCSSFLSLLRINNNFVVEYIGWNNEWRALCLLPSATTYSSEAKKAKKVHCPDD